MYFRIWIRRISQLKVSGQWTSLYHSQGSATELSLCVICYAITVLSRIHVVQQTLWFDLSISLIRK